ncbi:MAG TPA: hypothetical protein VMU09_04420 [Acidimicrobiales bacterium]|nr:hypothetical protein [Acidimicrobiales bacterium]
MWLRIVLVVGVALAVVLGMSAYGVVRYATRSHPGAKSVNSAIDNYRHTADPSSGSGYAEPAAGVYSLHGQGSEHISFPPNSQKDGAVMPATVTHLAGGCWRLHIDYNTSHAEEFVFCPTGAGLAQPTNINIQHWDYGAFGVSNTSTVSCPAGTVVLPVTPAAGQTLTWSCPETNTSVSGNSTSTTHATIVGVGWVRVGSSSVLAAHELQQTTVAGAQTGTVTENWRFDVATGMPVRIDRQISIHTNSPIGAIEYTESGNWTLASLTPHT